MNVFSRLLMVSVLLTVTGCEVHESELTVLDKAKILDQIDADPLKAKELCSQISEVGQREFCTQYALQAMPRQEVTAVRALCETLQGNAKGECWFQVAEKSLKIEDCENAVPFVEECYGHITLRVLIQTDVKTWEEIEHIANEHRLDLASPKYGHVVYQYWFRGTSNLNLEDCKAMKHPSICHDALGMLYLQRLKQWDLEPNVDCDSIPDKLAHNEQKIFKIPFENVYKHKCSGHK